MYCTVKHIEEEFNDIKFDSTTLVNDKQVLRFIEEASSYINARIVDKYRVPISEEKSPQSFIVLRNICIEIVSDRVNEIIRLKVKDFKRDTQYPERKTSKLYEIKLDQINKRQLKLIDCPTANTVSINISANDFEFDSLKW